MEKYIHSNFQMKQVRIWCDACNKKNGMIVIMTILCILVLHAQVKMKSRNYDYSLYFDVTCSGENEVVVLL